MNQIFMLHQGSKQRSQKDDIVDAMINVIGCIARSYDNNISFCRIAGSNNNG
jgi:hypothetical protein